MSIIPATGFHKIGDTINVIMDLNVDSLYDTYGDRIVSFPNINPNAWFLCPSLDTFPVRDGFLEHDVLINETYDVNHINVSTLSSGLFFLGIDQSETSSRLDFQLVLKKKGTYGLFVNSELKVDEDEPETQFPDRCGRGTMDAFYIINDENIHEDILTESNLDIENEYWIERHGQRKKSRAYYFKVEE